MKPNTVELYAGETQQEREEVERSYTRAVQSAFGIFADPHSGKAGKFLLEFAGIKTCVELDKGKPEDDCWTVRFPGASQEVGAVLAVVMDQALSRAGEVVQVEL